MFSKIFFVLIFLFAAISVALVAFKGRTKKNSSARVNNCSSLVKFRNGVKFRDLNKNGRLDKYEDERQPIAVRIKNLLGQMTLEEKAGMMFINGCMVNGDGKLEAPPGGMNLVDALNVIPAITEKHMTHFNLFLVPDVDKLALWYNNLQKFAEKTRLGIPITIASDPRNHFGANIFASAAKGFTQWPEPLGFAAIGNDKLTRQFADDSRQEYLAVGIREALHPQVDLALNRVGQEFRGHLERMHN